MVSDNVGMVYIILKQHDKNTNIWFNKFAIGSVFMASEGVLYEGAKIPQYIVRPDDHPMYDYLFPSKLNVLISGRFAEKAPPIEILKHRILSHIYNTTCTSK